MATTVILYFCMKRINPNNLAADLNRIMQFCKSVAINY